MIGFLRDRNDSTKEAIERFTRAAEQSVLRVKQPVWKRDAPVNKRGAFYRSASSSIYRTERSENLEKARRTPAKLRPVQFYRSTVSFIIFFDLRHASYLRPFLSRLRRDVNLDPRRWRVTRVDYH